MRVNIWFILKLNNYGIEFTLVTQESQHFVPYPLMLQHKPVKQKHTTDGMTTKQTTKRQKATPLLGRDQNVGTAEI